MSKIKRFSMAAGLAMALLGGGVVSGCASTSTNQYDMLSTGKVRPRPGLVMPSSALGSAIMAGDAAHWSYARNDREVNPRPAAQPWAEQWVETQLDEQLRISNGRPYEYTTMRQRTYRLAPSR